MTKRPQSKFMHLTDSEFEAGLRALEADAVAGPLAQPRPVLERYDVVALTLA